MSVVFSPLFPWPYLAALAVCIAAVGFYGVFRRVRGALLRMVALGLGVLALANPTIVREQRAPLSDVLPVVVDESPSQAIGQRTAQTQAALEKLRAELAQLPNLDVRIVRAGSDPDDPAGGTRLFSALDRALADVPTDRLAGTIMITDGEVHDAPAAAAAKARFPAPVHVLLTGAPDEGDRRLMVVRAPRFGIIGEPVSLTVRVDDFGPGAATDAPALLTVTVDGKDRNELFVRPGQDQEVSIALRHAGASIVQLRVAEGPHELTLANNRAALVINGVRDRLRVLLVSGEPNPGERTWRNLLRADPAVDLVHFTILRPPEKQDMTPINELSLIAFPTRELFAEKLRQFDLVIFDTYRRRGVLPYAYFGNLTRYVQGGGGLLIVGGPELATPLSLYRTPLAAVLPVQPDGHIQTGPFRPALTPVGRKHPVTADLPGGNGPVPLWGRWFRLVDGDALSGQTLMSGPDDKPLLVLDRVGQGRVAELMSDQAWLWARGFDGGGPQAELLRRLAHWLMKEPELEEERLSAQSDGGKLTITRRTLGDTVPPVTIVSPSGRRQTASPSEVRPGLWQTVVPTTEQGLYQLTEGDKTAMAAVGVLERREFRDVRATADKLAPVAAATGGSVRWLSRDGVPAIRMVGADRAMSGHDWIGLRANGRYTVQGIAQRALIPLLVVLLAVLGGLLAAWLREGR